MGCIILPQYQPSKPQLQDQSDSKENCMCTLSYTGTLLSECMGTHSLHLDVNYVKLSRERNKYLNISEPITYLIYHLQHCFLRPSVCVSIVHRYIHPIWKDLCEQLPCQSSTTLYPKADELQD